MLHIATAGLARALRFAESIKLRSTLYVGHSRDDHVHRPAPHQAAGCFQLFSIALLSSPSITTYTSTRKVQVLKCTIYEMGSSIYNGLKWFHSQAIRNSK